MISCPQCGLLLQTLDLPCPACSSVKAEDQGDHWTVHEFSKSFKTRHLMRPQPNEFMSELNAWLARQPGLLHVSPIIHHDAHGEVRGATLTCVASSRPARESFRFFRLQLIEGKLGIRRKDLGIALNEWAEGHPDYSRVTHQVLMNAGAPLECWVLAKGPPDIQALIEPVVRTPLARPHVIAGGVFFLFLFLLIMGVLGSITYLTHSEEWLGAAVLPGGIWGAIYGRRWWRRRQMRRSASGRQSELTESKN